MKVSKRDLGLLLGLIGLIAVFFTYQFVYTTNMEKKEQLESQLASLKVTENNLTELENNMEYYKSEISRMNTENAEIESHYPADILPENEIMYAVELEENADIYYRNLSYGSASLINTGYESATGINGYQVVLTMAYESTYNGLKNAILYNKAQNNRMVIDSVSASYDSTTGDLSGTIGLNMYYLTGTDTSYEAPYVPSMKIGTGNIFGSSQNN